MFSLFYAVRNSGRVFERTMVNKFVTIEDARREAERIAQEVQNMTHYRVFDKTGFRVYTKIMTNKEEQ